MRFRTGKTTTVGFGLVVRSANGVGSRFRATTNHMEDALPENHSRPLPQKATVIHLSVLSNFTSRCPAAKASFDFDTTPEES